MKRVAVASVIAAAIACAGVASADTPPSVWDRAKDPRTNAAWEAHVELHKRLEAAAELERFMRADVGQAMRADLRERIEAALKAHPNDPVLRFDHALVLGKIGRYAEAKRAFDAVLADHPNHPAADEAYWRLAEACGHLGDHPCEKKAYGEVLKRWTEEPMRTTPLLNLAEALMHLGELRAAVETYKECIRLTSRTDQRNTTLLCQWGLALAYDRSGDGLAALREATFATDLERSSGLSHVPYVVSLALRSPNVYFVPDYEIDWYEGLGAMALAKKADNDLARLAFWRRAEKSFGRYVAGAEREPPKTERWVTIAKNRLATSTAERTRAEQKVRANPAEAARIEETL